MPNTRHPLQPRHRVRFGLSLPNRAVLFGMPTELLLVTAEQAEASGLFDSVWVGDNFLSKPRLEAIVMLSALAARTQRLKLGTICLATFTPAFAIVAHSLLRPAPKVLTSQS